MGGEQAHLLLLSSLMCFCVACPAHLAKLSISGQGRMLASLSWVVLELYLYKWLSDLENFSWV